MKVRVRARGAIERVSCSVIGKERECERRREERYSIC